MPPNYGGENNFGIFAPFNVQHAAVQQRDVEEHDGLNVK